ncbi:zinc finger protein 106 [Caerostris extrusa]|uniref:Zinc finger protein 106 n=1 Tax=Caerostris extrusa TaxID=172846 RepID=A0AAV4NQN9_CAEEX|nr:zinc finger protein 106 [Caerostris extrusa]
MQVFTGNRNGEISVFKFHPDSSLPCLYGKCEMIFSRLEDLKYHLLHGKDHYLAGTGKCPWRKCGFIIKKNMDRESIKDHIASHVISMKSTI